MDGVNIPIDNNNLEDRIKMLISESKDRCKFRNLDPINGNKFILSEKVIKEKLRNNEQILRVSYPIINSLYNTVKGTGFVITLTDSEGYLIYIVGDEEILNESSKIHFVKGALWTEETVGTNGIGIVLKNDIPVQIVGEDHYCKIHHTWTCSTAPIHDEQNNLIGCLNLSGSSSRAHKHTLGMVLTAAYSIERQLALENSYKLMDTAFQSISDGMIILDENLKIMKFNNKSCEILKCSKDDLFELNIKDVLKDIGFIIKVLTTGNSYYDFDCDLILNNRSIKCVVNVTPIKSKDTINGLVMTFNISKTIHKVANKVVGNSAIYNFDNILSGNAKMKKLIEFAKKIAKNDANVLITGESGTGKELFAHSIHNYSNRNKESFIAINCAAIPRELLESELFGYEKGAFTGARKEGYIGKFELADSGTIFLDEIGEMPLDMQSKLLRVLDNKRISRIGSNHEKHIDVRIIAATNKNLIEEVEKKNFRMDLYYRLNVMNIKLISLRERKEDIEILARNFVEKLNEKNITYRKLSVQYINNLNRHYWSGNVRELKNIVERDYFLCEEDIISSNEFFEDNLPVLKEYIKADNNLLSLEKIEAENIKTALNKCNNNAVEAAKLLGIGKSTIYRKIKKYGI